MHTGLEYESHHTSHTVYIATGVRVELIHKYCKFGAPYLCPNMSWSFPTSTQLG